MSKSVLVIDTPENCYDCLFGTTYCGKLEYAGYCELAYRLNYDVILMTEKHYGRESKSRPDWCPLMNLPEKDNFDDLYDEYYTGYHDGWNDCLREIVRGKNK